jgi:purine-nucleoside/S-methyl-5'-thioadenosine phosphorylase / adenosine deaminase
MVPTLTPRTNQEVGWYEDAALKQQVGILVAFSTRAGGVSEPPYDSLNLAGHVGDDPRDVDENRRRLFEALGIGDLAERLVTAEQVHGDRTTWVGAADAGRGARVVNGARPVRETDALLTDARGVPLMLHYADCVPVVLVDPDMLQVAVVHAGWRGAFDRLPGKAVSQLLSHGSDPTRLLAYVGPHICENHYGVSNELLTSFVRRFGTVCEAEAGHLDLGAVVSEDISSSGVCVENICRLGMCTAKATDRFFSYRASSGVTGRHAALSVILG